MKPVTLVMLAALVPAGTNPSLIAEASGITVPLCSADGTVREVTIQLGDPVLPGSNATLCCAKGCHSDSKKKKHRRSGAY